MQKIPLYRYIRADGGVTVSTDKPETEYIELTRLVADEGYILVNDDTYTFCIDTDNPDLWIEKEDVEKLNN